MKFNEYIQIIHRYCYTGKTQADFMREFLSAAVNNGDIISKYDDESLRKWFNGSKKFPSTLARSILTNLDRERLDNMFLNEIPSEDALIEMGHDFEDEIGNVPSNSVATKLVDLFVDIIKGVSSNAPDSPRSEVISDNDVKKALTSIITSISRLSIQKIEALLSYNPVKVERKIPDSFPLLQKDVKTDVATYYVFVDNLFKELAAKNPSLAECLLTNIKNHSNQLIKQGLSYQAVVDKMVDYFEFLTASQDRTALKIIVSYFIQHCEVFDEITE